MYAILNESNHVRCNANNEYLIYNYLTHYRRANKQNDTKTCVALHKAIRSYEVLTDFKDFSEYCPELAHEFLEKLRNSPLSPHYLLRLVADVRDFLRWYAREKRKIKENDLDYMKLTRNELKEARPAGYQESHEYKTLFFVINQMKGDHFIQRRNRALFALAVLGGFRSGELRGLTIELLKKDNAIGAYFVDVNPARVRGDVKFRDSRQATLFNRTDLLQYVLDWVRELREKHQFCDPDPLFPCETPRFNRFALLERDIEKRPMGRGAVAKVFKDACAAADVKYINIHNFRHTKARFIDQMGDDNLMQAASQDFGHKSRATTLISYVGQMSPEKQRQLIAGVDMNSITPAPPPSADDFYNPQLK